MPLPMLNKAVLSRRTVLKSGAVSLALPLLDAMVPVAYSREARAAAAALAPRRLVLVSRLLGTYHPHLVPKTTGPTHEATRFLQHLEPFRGQYTVFSGMGHPGYPNDHRTEAGLFTGVPELNINDVHNTISLDQVAARAVRGETRFPYLLLGTTNHGLSWSEKGVQLPMTGRRPDMFRAMFVEGTPEEVRAETRRLEQGKSILDDLREQYAVLARGVGAADRDRLDRFATSVREAEELLAQEKAWSKRPKPKVDVKLEDMMSKQGENWISEQDRWLRLVHLALQTDSSRVIVFGVQQHGKTNVPGLEIEHHDASHHGKDPDKIEQLCRYEDREFQTFGKFLGLLDGAKEGSGTLLDSTQVLFTSNLGDASAHSSENLPVVLAGGGYRHQGHVSYGSGTNKPLCNLYVRMLQQFGAEAEQFGSSDGVVGEV
jgi:hypothetical protein